VRAAVIALAVVALIAIGSAEAWISNDELSRLPGRARPALSGGGAALTFIGVALSVAVYAFLGFFLVRDGARGNAVLGIGMAVGGAAGLIGGAIRAYLVRDYLGEVLKGYGLADLLIVTLAVFVALSVCVGVAAGAALTWLGSRAGRPPTQRPPS
jgi:predicted MFS family arabinose efflux permease